MNKSGFNYEILPKGVIDVIKAITKSDREYRTLNNYLLIVGLIYLHQMSDDASYYLYSPLSREYWRTVIGSHYSKYVDRLVKEKVIQRDWFNYVSDFGDVSRVMGYRVNPEFLLDDFTLMRYAGAISESESADAVNEKANGNIAITKLGIKPDLIRMQKRQALEWINGNISTVVNEYLNNEYVDGVPKTLPVLVRFYHDDDSFSASHMSVEAAQKIAEEPGKELLYYKDKFIIANKEQFTSIANHNLSVNYKWQVKSFLPEKFNFRRNKNTLRVYSKLSSLPTALLPFLRINGQYILQADLKCSQFVLFANLINYYINHSGVELIALFKKKQAKTFISGLVCVFEKHKDEFPDEGLNTTNPTENEYNTNDIYKFMVDCLLHDFYGIIKSELSLPQREHGKGIAFRTVFSKPKPQNELVRQFRHIYPTVISIINDFKDKYGYNQFAVGLQRVEAVIFIDKIWQKAKQAGINCFTRHDSLVFPVNKRKEVEQIITEVFKSFDFIYRIEFEEFNTDEIMLRLINETDYLDTSLDDFDEVFFYTMMHTGDENKMKDNELFWEQLQEITLPKYKELDYFDYVSLDTLCQIFELDGLLMEIQLALEEDIANLQSNYPTPQFQDGTNKLISKLIDIVND
jgi:hypothetical protein